MSNRLLTVLEAADMLRVSRRTVEGFVSSGQLRPVKLGRRTLFTEKELAAFIAARQQRRVA